MKNKILITIILVALCSVSYAQKIIVLTSPDGKVTTEVSIGKTIEYSVFLNGEVMLQKSPISLKLTNGITLGMSSVLKDFSKKSVATVIDAVIYKKRKIDDNYNELTLNFKNNFDLIFRQYNDGVAYRFVTNFNQPFNVENEQIELHFPVASKMYVPYVRTQEPKQYSDQFQYSFENIYKYTNITDWEKSRLAFLPILIETPSKRKICITESDLLNYPGMYLTNDDALNTLKGVFSPYPKEIKQGGYQEIQMRVQSYEPYIAKCEGQTSFPWRIIIVADKDHELVDNDMVYKLATPNKISDLSWIKPGKVAWDWWNDWNLRNVDFKAGINNATYKYYIDFASNKNIEYVILDLGWSITKNADLFQVAPEIDLNELVAYGNAKNVSIILWAGYWAFDRDMEAVCKHYSEMGIKGFKVDFMDRDDQLMVEFHHRAAQVAAKYKMLLDFHGTYKPTGLQRTYPNVMNFEGVHGLEQMKWAQPSVDQVTYDVTIPFIRMVAGPMDYTQGAMRNAIKSNFHPVYSEPMSQGTRCRQLAEYVIFESPLSMLCDNPSNYMAEYECTKFITEIPTIWDETIALNGEVAKYVSIARRSGNDWYIGSMTNWDKRELELDLSFLGQGDFKAEVFKDGKNAHRAACDYKKETIDIPTNKKLKIDMAPGGGFTMKISKR